MKSFFSILLLVLLDSSINAMHESIELNKSEINLTHYVESYPTKTILTGRDLGYSKTATLNENGEIRIWNTKTGALIKTLEGTYKNRIIVSLLICNSGHDLFIRTDTESFKVVISEKKLGGKQADIILTGYNSSHTKTATLDQSGWIQIWDTKTKELVHLLSTNYIHREVQSFCIADDGKWITIETSEYYEKVMLTPLSSTLIVKEDFSIIRPKDNHHEDHAERTFNEEEHGKSHLDTEIYKEAQEYFCCIQ